MGHTRICDARKRYAWRLMQRNVRYTDIRDQQFRSLANRWRFSATGHAGPLSYKVAAGAYQFCAATLCRVWSCRWEKSVSQSVQSRRPR